MTQALGLVLMAIGLFLLVLWIKSDKPMLHNPLLYIWFVSYELGLILANPLIWGGPGVIAMLVAIFIGVFLNERSQRTRSE